MYTSNEYDSEDDTGYFLTPVLHYNISDKIIEANKILFENKEQELPNNVNDVNIKKDAQSKRCVMFADELVSFEQSIALEPGSEDEAVVWHDTDIKEEKQLEEISENTTNEVNEIITALDQQLLLAQKEQEAEQQNKDNIADKKRKLALALDSPYPSSCENMTEQIIANSSVETSTLSNNKNDKINEQEIKKTENAISNKLKQVNCAKTREKKNDNAPKFNYKICCEYAAIYNGRQSQLPQYKGYISQYGPSCRQRKNLLQLNKRIERSQLEQQKHAQEQLLRKMTANEQAFSVWLLNKCRNAPNRTRNMFDYKSTPSHKSYNNLVKNNKRKINKIPNL